MSFLEKIRTFDLQPDEVTDVIYHDPCSDGTGAAYCAWKYFTTKYPEKEVRYRPMSVGASLPAELEGRNVLICDYSFRKDVLLGKIFDFDHYCFN
jgi:hypothetical protein